MSVSSESCYECGRDIPDGLGEPLYACLWNMPSAGGEHWAWVQVCPSCGGARRSQRRALLTAVSLFVSALAALLAYRFLP
jgi:hypothetical protein